jgi:curli biogenesis system outer membrane secretion channel CsgG
VPRIVFESPSKKTDTGLDELSGKVAEDMMGAGKTRIAVIDFCDLDGRVSLLGKFVAEELITRLFETGQFYVVERSLLTKVLEEQKLSLDPVIDQSTAQELGKILGVDAIVTGTITDLVDMYRLNARMIGTEKGLVFAAASTSLIKDRSLRALNAK